MNRLGLACVAFVALVANVARGAPDDDFRWRGNARFRINAQRLPLLLADFPKLEDLDLVPFMDFSKPAPLSDTAMTEIARVESLTHLRLGFLPESIKPEEPVQLTAAGWKALAKLKKLRVLCLAGGDFDDEALQAIGSLSELQTLTFLSCKVSPTGVKHLGNLKKLTGLSLLLTPVSEASCKEIGNIQNLELLEIIQAPLTESVLKELSQLSRIRYLSLGSAQATDAGLKHLATLKNLTDLTLWDNQVTDVGLKSLAEIKALRTLDLRGELHVTSKGIEWLRGQNARLSVADPIRPLKVAVEVPKKIANLVPVHKGHLGLAAVVPSEKVARAFRNDYQRQVELAMNAFQMKLTTPLWSHWDVELVAIDGDLNFQNRVLPQSVDLLLQLRLVSETVKEANPRLPPLANPRYDRRGANFAVAAFSYRCADASGSLEGQVPCIGWPSPEQQGAAKRTLDKLDWSLRKDFAARLMRPARQEEREKAGWYLHNPYPFVVQGNYRLVGPLKDIKLIPFRLVPGAKPLWVDTGSFVISDLILSGPERLPAQK